MLQVSHETLAKRANRQTKCAGNSCILTSTICMSIWPNGAHTCAKEGLPLHSAERKFVSVHEMFLPPRAVSVVPTAALARRGEARVWPCCCSDVRRVVAGSRVEVRLVASCWGF